MPSPQAGFVALTVLLAPTRVGLRPQGSPIVEVRHLAVTIDHMALPAGIANSLVATLGHLVVILGNGNPGNDGAACGTLGAFIHQVVVKSRGSIPQLSPAQANTLLQAASMIRMQLRMC